MPGTTRRPCSDPCTAPTMPVPAGAGLPGAAGAEQAAPVSLDDRIKPLCSIIASLSGPEWERLFAMAEASLSALPESTRKRLAYRIRTAAPRKHWIEKRDAAIRELAGRLMGNVGGQVWPLADQVHDLLSTYELSGPWRFERDLPAPKDARRTAEHRILLLHWGRVPSRSTIGRALNGSPAQKFPKV